MVRDVRDIKDQPDDAEARSELERQRATPKDWGDHNESSDGLRTTQLAPVRERLHKASGSSDLTLQRHDYDHGKLKAALDAYKAHPETLQKAVECGRFMAYACKKRAWQDADDHARKDALVRLSQVAEKILSTEPSAVYIVYGAPRRNAGWSVRGELAVADHILAKKEVRSLIATVAHESRHQWQRDVISGQQEHPDGEPGRSRLIQAMKEYDSDQTDLHGAYFLNELEMDCEVFERVAVMGYDSESEAIRQFDIKSLARLALKDYS